MLAASELKVGVCFMNGDDPMVVQRSLGNKTSRGPMVYRVRIKNIVTGQTMDAGFSSDERFHKVNLDIHNANLSYVDGDNYVFMDNDTYEQIEINKEDLGENINYLAIGDEFAVEITFFQGKPVGIKVPIQVVREIEYCEPGIKGDTTGKATKPATLDTGFELQVPLFCEIGTKIAVDTRDGSFIEKAK